MANLMKAIENALVYRCDRCGWDSQPWNDREVVKSSLPSTAVEKISPQKETAVCPLCCSGGYDEHSEELHKLCPIPPAR